MNEDTPDCAGYWVANVTCDGGINSSGEDEAPCSWRKKCRIIQDHLIKTGSDPQAYRGRYGIESFNNLISKLEEERRPKRKYTKKKVVRRKKKPKRLETPEEVKKRRYTPLKEIVRGPFSDALERACDGVKAIWCHKKTEATRPGCIYLVDRTKASKAYTLFMRMPKDRPFKLCVIKLKPYNKGIDVQIRAEEKPVDLPNNLRWVVWVDHPMKSGIKTLRTKSDFDWIAKHLVEVAKAVL